MKYSSTNTQQALFYDCQAHSKNKYMIQVTDYGKWSMGGVFEIQGAPIILLCVVFIKKCRGWYGNHCMH